MDSTNKNMEPEKKPADLKNDPYIETPWSIIESYLVVLFSSSLLSLSLSFLFRIFSFMESLNFSFIITFILFFISVNSSSFLDI
jgi:hypothetical protein